MTTEEAERREQELREVRRQTLALMRDTDPVLQDLRVQLGVVTVFVERLEKVAEAS